MASPQQAGDATAEPTGSSREVAIDHETLQIDLRPLENDDPAQVSATYAVRSDAAVGNLDLSFIAPGLRNSGFAVTLDGAPVPSRQETAQTLPQSWQPPSTTPALDGHGPLNYAARGSQTLRFSLQLQPGSHEIQVRYAATAAAYSDDSPVRYWQLGYVLAPARDWASFGTLDAAVLLPPGWQAATDPSLGRDGDTLTGHFHGIPSDALTITTQAPVPMIPDPFLVALVGGALATVALGVLAGRWLAGRGRTTWLALPVGLVVGTAWAISLIVAATSDRGVPAGQVAWTYDYGQSLLALFFSPVAWLVGIVLCQVAAILTARRVRLAAAVAHGRPTPADAVRRQSSRTRSTSSAGKRRSKV